MGKRWTEAEDRFIHAYYPAIGPSIGPRDLGRSEKATETRALFLVASGAWDALSRERDAHRQYKRAVGFRFAEDFGCTENQHKDAQP